MPAPLSLLTAAILIPLGTFVVLTIWGRRMGAALSGSLGTVSTLAAFASALLAMMNWLGGGVLAGDAWGPGRDVLSRTVLWTMPGIFAGPVASVRLGLQVDSLSVLVATAGLLVSSAAHVFTTGYLRNDVRGPRTFALLSLCDAVIVLLAASPSLAQWAVCGVFLSVGGYLMALPVPLGPGGLGITPVPRGLTPDDLNRRASAALVLLLVRFVGDAALLLACGYLGRWAPTLGWDVLWAGPVHGLPSDAGPAAYLLILAAVCHASAFPANLFLPDAKGFPTPAAAMSFGVYLLPTGVLLLLRVFPLLSEAQLGLLVVIGAITVLCSVLPALFESDLRRLLAWIAAATSGAMFCAVGVGSVGGAMLHVIAAMFGVGVMLLAGGSVLHVCLGERRLSRYGGLLFRMPATALLMAHGIGTLLGGPLLAGSGSWNTMLSHAYRSVQAGEWRGEVALAALGVGLVLTAVAAARGWSLMFLGAPRDRIVYAAARESATLTVPVALLALIATVAGDPIWSPVRQLVLVGPDEVAAVATGTSDPLSSPESPAYPGMALARDIAPPVVRPPPAPEDRSALEALEDTPLPPDDKTPRLVDPLRWAAGFVAGGIGLLAPLALTRHRRHRSTAHPPRSTNSAPAPPGLDVLLPAPPPLPLPAPRARWLARAGYVSLKFTSVAGKALVGTAKVALAMEQFVVVPLLARASRLLLPVFTAPPPTGRSPRTVLLPIDAVPPSPDDLPPYVPADHYPDRQRSERIKAMLLTLFAAAIVAAAAAAALNWPRLEGLARVWPAVGGEGGLR